MLKIGKIGAAILLSLLMSLTLLASGVFAQDVTNTNAKTGSHVAVATGSQQGVKVNLQVVDTQRATPQQANRWCRWRWVRRWGYWRRVWICTGGWWGGGWWHRGGWWHGGGWWHRHGWHRGWHRGGW